MCARSVPFDSARIVTLVSSVPFASFAFTASLNQGANSVCVGRLAKAILAAPTLELGGLTLLAVDNHSSTIDMKLPAKLEAFGWVTRTVDGHDHAGLETALCEREDLRPTAVIADIPEGEW